MTTVDKIRRLRRSLGGQPAGLALASSARWYRSPVQTLDAHRRCVIEQLDNGHHWVWITGEPIWQGRTPHEARSWTTYEALINIVFAPFAETVICPYDERQLRPPILASAGTTHPRIRTVAHVDLQRSTSPARNWPPCAGPRPRSGFRRRPIDTRESRAIDGLGPDPWLQENWVDGCCCSRPSR
jgi:hypothetical protein